MIVEDYHSFYNLLDLVNAYWDFKSNISISEFLELNPEYELSDLEIEKIYHHECASLSKYLQRFSNETEMLRALRTLFDDYRSWGGDALTWLYFTFDNVSLNPQNFPPEHLGIIEKNLIQWIDNYTKQPYDLLAENIKFKDAQEFSDYKFVTKVSARVFALFCSIVNQSKVKPMHSDESKETYCRKISTYFKIEANPQKVRQFFNCVMDIKKSDSNLRKVKELIFPNIPIEEKEKLEAFINNVTELYA